MTLEEKKKLLIKLKKKVASLEKEIKEEELLLESKPDPYFIGIEAKILDKHIWSHFFPEKEYLEVLEIDEAVNRLSSDITYILSCSESDIDNVKKYIFDTITKSPFGSEILLCINLNAR